MPLAALTPAQLGTLLHLAGVPVGPGSPLPRLDGAPLPADHPDLAALVAGHLAETDARGLRANHLVTAALLACARPDEVLWLTTAEPGAGFTVCRTGPVWSECTPLADGRTKLAFPITRRHVILAVTSALSGDRREPVPTGFRFRGPAVDAFVLRVLLDGARRGGLPHTDVPAAVAAALSDPVRLLAFAPMAGVGDLLALRDRAGDLDAALVRLQATGHLRMEGGRLLPSATALAVLGAPVLASLAVGRRSVGDGRVRERELLAYRCGERLLLLQAVPVDGSPVVELREVTRAELRCLAVAFLLDERELRAVLPPG